MNSLSGPSRSGATPSATPSSAQQNKLLIPLSAELLGKFQPAKRFSDAVESTSEGSGGGKKTISSLCFDDAGEKLVTAGEDDVFVLWDARKGRKVKNLYSRKYGIDHVRFTHKSGTIVHASTKGDDHAVRYHSMHDNKYLAYFKGHTARVRSVHMSPVDDTFVTAGDDGTVRLWDLRKNACLSIVQDIGGSTIAAMDNQGIVIAVACSETQTILLYATGTSDRAPFAHAPLHDIAFEAISQPPPKPIFTSIQFSNDGRLLLIGTSSDVHYILDGFDLTPLRRLVGHQGLERNAAGEKGIQPRRGSSGSEVSWTADSNWVVSGSVDGNVLFWDIAAERTGQKVMRNDVEEHERAGAKWHTIRIPEVQPKLLLRGMGGISRAVRFNPRYNLLAVGGEDLSLWLPGKDEDEQIAEGY